MAVIRALARTILVALLLLFLVVVVYLSVLLTSYVNYLIVNNSEIQTCIQHAT